MKRRQKRFPIFAVCIVLIACCSINAFAVTEAEVQTQVNAVGRDSVTGSIFIWFLCAIAFLKISQKIDSFMSALGINVGNTGGSMLSEMLIAARGISLMASGGGRGGGKSGGSGGGSGGGGGSEQASFMQGGLVGSISRSMQRGAANNATGISRGGLGGKAYTSSLAKGGGFANRVIGNIATGRIPTNGSITGENASQALTSYMGYTALGEGAADVPSFSDVEIGGGHIFATETSDAHPNGIAMGLYNTEQYMAPDGEFSVVEAADGTSWYKQYAADTVERTPYYDDKGQVAYNEKIVQKLPKIPQRKDRI